MMIDFTSNKDSIELSYVAANGQIIEKKVPLKTGYYDIDVAEEYEVEGNPDIIPNLYSMKDKKPLKFVPSYKFGHQAKNYFIDNTLKTLDAPLHSESLELRIPNYYSVDIEIEVTDEFGYSNQNKVENRILWISVTNEKFNSVGYALKTDIFKPYIGENNRIHPNYLTFIKNEIVKIYGATSKYGKQLLNNLMEVVFFDSEIDMLIAFLNDMRIHYHCIIGHNFLGYDWTYISNRCKKLNIPLTIASPTNKLKEISFGKKRKNKNGVVENSTISVPVHRPILDNMIMFQTSLSYNNLESYSLEALGQLVLHTGKISYDGNLKKLYEEDPVRFMMYAFVDAILVVMLQQETNLMQVDFYESYLNKIPFMQLSQNAISESLVYYNLKKKNQYLPTSEHNHSEDQKYVGGYVKTPTKKETLGVFGLDYSGLYVNCIIAMGISTEARVDKVDVDEYGYPLTEADMKTWEYWKSQGQYILSPLGYIYDNREEPLFVSIEKETAAKRAIFKKHAEKIYLELEAKIENRIKQLKTNQ